MSRPSKQKREKRRLAILHAEQARVFQKVLAERHANASDPTWSYKDHVRTGLDGAMSRALHGPRAWSKPEPHAVIGHSLGKVEANDKPHFVNDKVLPKQGRVSKRGNLDGFTPKFIDGMLAKKTSID